MKPLFYLIILSMLILAVPQGMAQTTNSDFNPFPQMEQDVSNSSDGSTPASDQQNQDQWPPANSDAQSGGQ